MHRTKSKALKFLRAAILSGAAVLTSSALESGAARAQEVGAGLIQRQAAFEEVLGRIEAALTWAPVAPNVKAFDAWLKQDPARREAYEFGISRNSGFRILTISNWNGGNRYATEPYMTGDTKTGGPHTGFHMGGSLWVIGTQDPEEKEGPRCVNSKYAAYPPEPDQDRRALHYYYFYGPDGVKPVTSNGCVIDGPVYARARLFKP